MLAATAYAGHLGKGTVVGSESFPPPYAWHAVGASDGYAQYNLKLACEKKIDGPSRLPIQGRSERAFPRDQGGRLKGKPLLAVRCPPE